MPSNINKKPWLTCLIIGIFLLIPGPDFQLLAGNEEESKQQKWVGKVTIISEGSQIYEKDKSTISRKWTSSYRHYLFDKVTIVGCGQLGKLDITQVSRSMTHTEERRSFKQNMKELCPPTEEMKKHGLLNRTKKGNWPSTVKRPGDSSKLVERSEWKLYTGNDCPSLKDLAEIGLRVLPDGSYILGASSSGYTNYSVDSNYEEKDACNGKMKQKVYIISTGSLKEKGTTSVSEAEDGSNYFMHSIAPPIPNSLSCFATGKSGNNTITGSKIISEKKAKNKDGWESKITASWSFQLSEEDCNCFGTITHVQGDVKINGKKAEMGIIAEDLKGVEINTGNRSRLRIEVGDNLRIDIGSKSKVILKNPCKKQRSRLTTPESIILGEFWGYAIFYLISDHGPFVVECASAGGVRGQLYPVPGLESEKIVVASLPVLPMFAVGVTAINDKYTEVMPDKQEINGAAVVFSVNNSPDHCSVKTIKGTIKVQDSSGNEKILKAGQSFKKDWGPTDDLAKIETIYIKANQ